MWSESHFGDEERELSSSTFALASFDHTDESAEVFWKRFKEEQSGESARAWVSESVPPRALLLPIAPVVYY